MRFRRWLLGLLILLALTSAAAGQPQDPLPSWHDGKAKTSIADFVARVTREGGPDFVPRAERIATFDNDGTLWVEQPVYFQLAFALDRIRAMALSHPEWKTTEPFRSLLRNDLKGVVASGEKGMLQIMAASHSGMTTDEFASAVRDWLATARHPRFNRRYDSLVYQPMLELLAHLRANGFKIFVVSGGGIDFMRPWMERVYGIPPEQVVGSSGVTSFTRRADGSFALVKQPKVEFVDDGPGKPSGIHRFIGRRPIFAFGNSDGDLQMLQWVTSAPGPSFAGLVHHTDAAREYAYDRQSKNGKLDKALDAAAAAGWTVVDMAGDWKEIFPPLPATTGAAK